MMATKIRDQDVEFMKKLLGDDAIRSDNSVSKKSFRKIQEAYTRSHEVRKFEIELYWKRATYFWAFITTLAAIFGLCIENKHADYFILSPIVANIGFITALCFHYVNLGSKYWQKNWEQNVDKLEFYISGNLYKINYYSETGLKHSVSNVNNHLSSILSFTWLLIFIGSVAYTSFNNLFIVNNPIVIFLFSVVFVVSFVWTVWKLNVSTGGKHDYHKINYYIRSSDNYIHREPIDFKVER